MAEMKGGASLGDVYWLPTPMPLEDLHDDMFSASKVSNTLSSLDSVFQDGKPKARGRTREQKVADFAYEHWLPDAEPGDLLLVCHPGPVIIGVVEYLADTDVPDPKPEDMLKVTLSEKTLNWVTLGRDHRLARIGETWQNGQSLTPRAIQGVVDAARSVESNALADLLAPGGDDSRPDEITQLLDNANYNGSVVPILTSARARAAVLGRTSVEIEDLLYSYLNPHLKESAPQLMLRIFAASPKIIPILEEGWITYLDDQLPMELSQDARDILDVAATLEDRAERAAYERRKSVEQSGISELISSMTGGAQYQIGLRDTSLLAVLLLGRPGLTDPSWSGIVPGRDFESSDTLIFAGRMLRLAEAGAIPEPSHVRYLRPSFEAIANDVDFDELVAMIPAEDTLAEDAQKLAEQWLYTSRAQTPPTRSDVPGGTDYIGVRNEAAAFARLIALKTTRLPLSVGVFGHWGSGKTFFLNAVEEEVRKITENPPEGFLSDVVIVKFNAWHYMETNIWASLVDVIFRELHAAQNRSATAKDTATLFEAVRATQSDRMDALEAFASKLAKAKVAQEQVLDAAEAFAADGPRVRAIAVHIGEAILTSYAAQFKAAKAELEAAGKPVPNALTGDREAAAVAAYDTLQMVRKARAEGTPLLARMRQRIARPSTLLLLAGALLAAPFAVSQASKFLGIPGMIPELTTILSTLTLASGMIARGAKTGLKRLTDFTAAVEGFEASDPKLKELVRAQEQAGASLAAARSRYEVQDEAARKALEALQNETVTSRLSRLLQDRATGDIYTQHLGVIATVREDFERLSALLQQQRDMDTENKAWADYKEHTEQRIAALRAQYSDLVTEDGVQRAKAARKLKEQVARDLGDKAVPSDIPATPLSREVPLTNYGAQLTEQIALIEDQLETTPADKKPINRVMLVIDDLDRCPPKKVYEVLQAVHLFLGFPLFVAMVGVDTRWMATALKEELGKLVDGENGATPQDYLEKIFQIPYWTKPIDGEGAEKLVRGILGAMTPAETSTTRAIGSTPEPEGTAQIPAADSAAKTGETLEIEIEPGSAEDIQAPEAALAQVNPGLLDMVRPTPDEVAYLAQIGAFAGATPRRIIRLTNVFMLLKATWSTRLRGNGFAGQAPEEDAEFSRAVLTQLAICTGTPEWSGLYFTVLQDVAKTDEPTLPDLRAALEKGMESRKVAAPDAARILGLIDVYLSTQKDASLDWLLATATDARTYTFAAPDALRRELLRAQATAPDAAS